MSSCPADQSQSPPLVPPEPPPLPPRKAFIQQQLVLETRLQEIGGKLTELYKKTRQLNYVAHLVQTLESNSERLSSLFKSVIDPSFTFSMEDNTPDDDESVAVVEEDDHWVITVPHRPKPVKRTLNDINYLKSHLAVEHSLEIAINDKDPPTCSALQEFLSSLLSNDAVKQDYYVICFLSDEVKDFSLINSKSNTTTTTNPNVPIADDQSETVPASCNVDEKVTKVSSCVSIEELEGSPQIPKRIAAPIPTTTEQIVPSPPVSPRDEQLSPVKTRLESSSDEIVSETPSETETRNETSQKSQGRGFFHGASKTSSKKQRKKSKKNKEDGNTVSLVAPQLSVTWDPTCLLEELYNDCQPGVVSQSPSGENSRYHGHLDKLPVNQRKPAVMKGWKRRFFRLTRGSLFYYDGEASTKATSFIRLSDSKIVQHPDFLQLEIIEKGSGNFIMLRAESMQDLVSWYRVLQLEAVHPTMTHRLSVSPDQSTSVLIIDLGACSVRAGIVHDNTYPQLFFPTVCTANGDKIVSCGNEALLPEVRSTTKLLYPCRHRVRMDTSYPTRECFQFIIEKVCKSLHLEPQNSSALVCISPVMAESDQIALAEVLLEVLNFKSILIQEQTTMALYSYNHTSGIVVNIGDSTDIVPIIDGFKVDAGTSHTPFGGHSINENLSKLIAAEGIRYFSEAEMYVIRYIKENICFLSQSYPDDESHCEETPSDFTRAVDVDRFQLSDHRKVIHLDAPLFKSPEGLFSPGMWGKDVLGLHEMVQKAIEQCPIDMRRQMVRHIYLAGGTTLLVGLQERLQKELEIMNPRLEVQVHASENRHHAAFLGAGVLASLNSFAKSLVDVETWAAKGLDAMRQNDI